MTTAWSEKDCALFWIPEEDGKVCAEVANGRDAIEKAKSSETGRRDPRYRHAGAWRRGGDAANPQSVSQHGSADTERAWFGKIGARSGGGGRARIFVEGGREPQLVRGSGGAAAAQPVFHVENCGVGRAGQEGRAGEKPRKAC